MYIDHLIVDSSAFIHNGPIRKTGKDIYTCEEVLDEIKDKATLENLRVLPYELKLLQFDKDDLEKCIDFSKKTGDYKQLSVVDLKLIAATYGLEKRYNGYRFINKEPKTVSIKPIEKSKNRPSDRLFEQLSEVLKSTSINDSPDQPVSDADFERIMEEECATEEEESESDDEGWITPSNIKNVYQKIGFDKPASVTVQPGLGDRVPVACMTSDFSIQNCLLQMGLLVISPVDGLMIKEAKKIALRCHACFKVFHDLNKIKNNFCPHCGNLDTLKRVQYIVEEDGTKRVLINFKRPIKVKGTNKQLPRPRGGKHANNPILTADQRIRKDKLEKFVVQEKKNVNADLILNDPAYLVRTNPFSYRSNRVRRR